MLKVNYQCLKCSNSFEEQPESSLAAGFCPECSQKMTKEVAEPVSVSSYGRDLNLLQIFEAHGASPEGAAAVSRDVFPAFAIKRAWRGLRSAALPILWRREDECRRALYWLS